VPAACGERIAEPDPRPASREDRRVIGRSSTSGDSAEKYLEAVRVVREG